jgi:hypothetical protein
MQQLSLEQLEVESYAVQPSEQELTNLKGGTGKVCTEVGKWVVKNGTWVFDKGVEIYKHLTKEPVEDDARGFSGTTYYGVDSVKTDSVSYYGIDSVRVGPK